MRVEVLSDNEVQALIMYLPECPIRDRTMVRLMLQCGLRAGEVANLNIESVSRDGFINPAVHIAGGTSKNHVPRWVDIPEPLQSLLKIYLKSLPDSITPLRPDAPLFLSVKRKNRIAVRDIERITAIIARAALGRHIHPHILRHTYATMLLRYTNIRVVQSLLGHANLNTTQIYTHPTSQQCKTAVNDAFDH